METKIKAAPSGNGHSNVNGKGNNIIAEKVDRTDNTDISAEMETVGEPDSITSISPAPGGKKAAVRLKPAFDTASINPESLNMHMQELKQCKEQLSQHEILNHLLEQFEEMDFWAMARYPRKMRQKHYLIPAIENLLDIARENDWALCRNHDFIYLYNGSFWKMIDKEMFKRFLGEASEKMGIDMYDARHFQFRENLFKQFLSASYLPAPEPTNDKVLINLKNGTFEVTPDGTRLRPFAADDFITYQLPFDYNPDAQAPLFEKYLNRVLPDKQRQLVLAEYLGFVFMKHGSKAMKEEKALICYGGGANGKSVLFEVTNALLGNENVSTYSLQSLTNENGYFRAKIANKLVNYASEISGSMNTAVFKQLVSGEPVEARLPYGQPFSLTQYAKMIFNCNELPRDVEHTTAYFRRFLIVPFDVTIPEEEQDKKLHTKIIDMELSGVFNWVLGGLDRLLKQRRFSQCDAAVHAMEKYKLESDSVKLFLDESNYEKSNSDYSMLKQVYLDYRAYCNEGGYKAVNKSNFRKRLESFGVTIERKNSGIVAFLS